jgi:flap endonuclease-1
MGIKGLAKLLSDEAPDCIREAPLSSLHGRKIFELFHFMWRF